MIIIKWPRENNIGFIETNLLNKLPLLVEQTQQQVIVQNNSSLTLLFWKIGFRINNIILQNKLAKYGKQIVLTLSVYLESKYRRNFEEKNLLRMMQFADQFRDKEILATLSRQLCWSHLFSNNTYQMFYANQVKDQLMSVRDLRKQIAKKTFERIAIINLQIPASGDNLQYNFKDSYLLDFLNLGNAYLEKDLQQAILNELEKFILEFGKVLYLWNGKKG